MYSESFNNTDHQGLGTWVYTSPALTGAWPHEQDKSHWSRPEVIQPQAIQSKVTGLGRLGTCQLQMRVVGKAGQIAHPVPTGLAGQT